jgi:CheY-like chemotaxis protein
VASATKSWDVDRTGESPRGFELARVLVVDADPASRLTLQTVLKAGGYHVDSAASAAEAISKLDEKQYELVLSDLEVESPEAGLKVMAHARITAYKPAIALIHVDETVRRGLNSRASGQMLIETEDVPELLTKVATLIGERAKRRVAREMRAAGN